MCRAPAFEARPDVHPVVSSDGKSVELTPGDTVLLAHWIERTSESIAALAGCSAIEWVP